MNVTETSIADPSLPDEFDDTDESVLSAQERAPIALNLTEADCGERLDKVLARHITQFSRSRLQLWIEAGCVIVDGKPGNGKKVMLGDESILVFPQEAPEDAAYKPEPMQLPIVYEDDAIIVVDKPAGMVVHPAAGNWSGTLLNGLLHHFPPIAFVPRAGIVHRLDKDTSGLMVVAKTLEAQTDLVRQLQARTVKREYLALVWGTPSLQRTVNAAIGRHPRDRVKMAVVDSPTAKPAITHYERLVTGALDRIPVSLIRCRLETGRTHQIRVHMQSAGYPLVGDASYGKQHLTGAFPRQALHACRLGLLHPTTGAHCEWTAPLPEDFASLLERAGIQDKGGREWI